MTASQAPFRNISVVAVTIFLLSNCGQVVILASSQVNPGGSVVTGDGSISPTISECDVTDEACEKEAVGLMAIGQLHRLIDDDMNGNVDPSESDEFLRDELQYTDGFERHSLFHNNDKQISIEDLWDSWRQSPVYNWTVDEVLEWLEVQVELPQYIELFSVQKIDGSSLPRIAANTNHYLSSTLGVKNPVHKHKLAMRAMDVVLFGAPKKAHNYVKDMALVASLMIAIGGCWFAYAQHRYSQGHMKKMMQDLDMLQNAEKSLCDLQEKLDRAECEQQNVNLEKQSLEEKFRDEINIAKSEAERLRSARENSEEEMLRLKYAEEELNQVRNALKQAEEELETRSNTFIPSELQMWLQLTHEIELTHYMAKRQAAERQLRSARDECERLRKKRNAVMGTLRMGTGNTMDEIDQRIAKARAALEDIRQDIHERTHRWAVMENICGFSLVTNSGLTTLCKLLQREITSMGTIVYGVPPISGVPPPGSINMAMKGPPSTDDDEDDLPPSYHKATGSFAHSLREKNGHITKPHSANGHTVPHMKPKAMSEPATPAGDVTFHLGGSSPPADSSKTDHINNNAPSPTSQLPPSGVSHSKSQSFIPQLKTSRSVPVGSPTGIPVSNSASNLSSLEDTRRSSEGTGRTRASTLDRSKTEGNISETGGSMDNLDDPQNKSRMKKGVLRFLKKVK